MTNTISREQEQAQLQLFLGGVTLEFAAAGQPLRLDLQFLSQGYDIRPRAESYDHPAPPFCRLFVFFNRGARITVAGRCRRLAPEKIYLLPDGMPFTVTYAGGSELLFFHVTATDFCRMPVFGGLADCQCLDDPPLTALLAGLRRQPWGTALQAAAAAVLARFAERQQEAMLARAWIGAEFRPLFQALAHQPPARIRIDPLARQMGLGAAALAMRFRRKMGVPLKAYLTRETVAKSQNLLRYTEKTVDEIASQLGFTDAPYFHRYFRRHTGRSPAAYRAEAKTSQA
ncbi:MAG: helix-turn-helix transcriptional regulator [Lentisphaeria bacterium]